MSPTSPEAANQKRKHDRRACTGCRQQKLKCDAYLDNPKGCTRCRKLNLECKIEESFKRTNKRMKLAEMQQHVELLERQLGYKPTVQVPGPDTPSDEADSPHMSLPQPNSFTPLSTLSTSDETTLALAPGAPQPRSISPIFNGCSAGKEVCRSPPAPDRPTLTRVLDGLQVEPGTIDEVFKTYFRNYAYLLPILDPETSPNGFYNQSPFLFWTILAVGSRKYQNDPTLLGSLAPRLIKRYMMPLQSGAGSLQIVEGLLLLSTWPLPSNTLSKDASFALSGLIVHLALRLGLHIPAYSQDFARTKLVLNDSDIQRRARLWAYCIFTCQTINNSLGFPSTMPPKFVFKQGQTPSARCVLPKELHTLVRLSTINSRANMAMAESGLAPSQPEDSARKILIKIFEDQVLDLETDAQPLSTMDALYFDCSRLQLRVYYLFNDPSAPNIEGLSGLYGTACNIIRSLYSLNEETRLMECITAYLMHMMVLAACTLLKLLKCTFSRYLDKEEGRGLYFKTISLARSSILENNDMSGRIATIMTQLWTSDKIFREHEGAEPSLRLRVRSRFGTSVTVDTIWWWREEFGGQPSVYSKRLDPAIEPIEPQNDGISKRTHLAPDFHFQAVTIGPPSRDLNLPPAPSFTPAPATTGNNAFLDEQFLMDLDRNWAASLGFPIPDTAYGNTAGIEEWQSAVDSSWFGVN